MSLREEMWRYEQLTGESAEHIPIIQLGAYLDGVDKGIEELEKIKAEVDKKYDELYVIDEFTNGKADSYVELFEIIDKHISELKGE